jgi:ribosomal protein RSM22 (predicted rRNA methylase)
VTKRRTKLPATSLSKFRAASSGNFHIRKVNRTSIQSVLQHMKMLNTKVARPLCRSCQTQLLSLFDCGFVGQRNAAIRAAQPTRRVALPIAVRSFGTARRLYSKDNGEEQELQHADAAELNKQYLDYMERNVRDVRQVFGEVVPEELLEEDELHVYERLYGKPSFVSESTIVEDRELLKKYLAYLEDEAGVQQLEELEQEEADEASELAAGRSTLYKERPGGGFDEVDMEELENDEAHYTQDPREVEDLVGDPLDQLDPSVRQVAQKELNFKEQPNLISKQALEKMQDLREQGRLGPNGEELAIPEEEQCLEDEDAEPEVAAVKDPERLKMEQYLDELDEATDPHTRDFRTHPYTTQGSFGTNPSTLYLPKDNFINPIASVLAKASNKHLIEFAHKTFGGRKLPDSVATPSNRGNPMQQKPIALEASQGKMRAMEANAYLGAMMPGLYAIMTNILTETRKRLGSEWLEELLRKPGGPRILDAGGGGAAVLAWRDVLRAEWERMHPDGTKEPAPLGKATVVIGSHELRSDVSSLLENTTFLPRIPDFSPARDIPGAKNYDASARKQYDIVIAPNTLWTLEEDYMRKYQVQNFWSLLDPKGGVLILSEKGVPRGFELVAGARETLTNYHIISPGQEVPQDEYTFGGAPTEKETGMIIAPCTNHDRCPMYVIPGEMAGRKDHCHFQQRYIRPEFLQRILGETGKNYEDIRFSYIAVRRGKDLRQERDIVQNEEATLAALEGYEKVAEAPEALSLPRVMLTPIKRHRHVTMDVCTPSAQIERWTMPMSKSKQGYHDARKSRWGDLWALGAKTRVIRDVRTGAPKKELKIRKRLSKGEQRGENYDPDYVKPGRRVEKEPVMDEGDVRMEREIRRQERERQKKASIENDVD